MIKKLEIKFILNVYERFSHLTERWLGLNCFHITHIVNSIMLVGVATLICLYVYIGTLEFAIGWCFAAIGCIATFLETRNVQKNCYEDLKKGLKNKLLIEGQKLRIELAIIAIGIVSGFISLSYIESFFSQSMSPVKHQRQNLAILMLLANFLLYVERSFIACTPLPPNTSNLRKFFNWIILLFRKGFKKAQPEPTGEPLPA